MKTNFSHRFLERDYVPAVGVLSENRLFAVNHICIHEDCTIFNDIVMPHGAKEIEEKTTEVIDEILHTIVPVIQKKENRNKKIIICGDERSRRMLERKLEDRLKRSVG